MWHRGWDELGGIISAKVHEIGVPWQVVSPPDVACHDSPEAGWAFHMRRMTRLSLVATARYCRLDWDDVDRISMMKSAVAS